jgi:lysophospholipase L1-like esterase
MFAVPRRLVRALIGAVAVAGLCLLPAGTSQAESNGGVRIMPLGDSITDGMTVPGGYRIDLWKKLVADGRKVDFVGSMSNGPSSLGDHDHEGHSGWTISQIDQNIVNWLKSTQPRAVLLHIGTNDMWAGASGAPDRLSQLIDKITSTSPKADVFVATIIPFPSADAAVRTYNKAIPGIVQSKASAGKKVHLVDMFPALTNADLADNVHPNATGYSKMADVWHKALRSVPEIFDPTVTSGPVAGTRPWAAPAAVR